MVIKVTEQHIKDGIRGLAGFCPIDNATGGISGFYTVEVKDKCYRLPAIAREFIQQFENGEKCKPIEFDMEEME